MFVLYLYVYVFVISKTLLGINGYGVKTLQNKKPKLVVPSIPRLRAYKKPLHFIMHVLLFPPMRFCLRVTPPSFSLSLRGAGGGVGDMGGKVRFDWIYADHLL